MPIIPLCHGSTGHRHVGTHGETKKTPALLIVRGNVAPAMGGLAASQLSGFVRRSAVTCSNPVERYTFTSRDLLLYVPDGGWTNF